MALLKRAGFFGSYPPGTSIARATSLGDLRTAFSLVHDSFVDMGYIQPAECGMRIRCFEALPEAATFVAWGDGEIAGVLSVVPDTPEFGVPADKAFRDEIDKLRAEGRRICEGTNWVMAEKYRNTPLMTELMRCAFAHAMAEGYTDFLGAVSPGHVRFYSLLAFEPVSDVRSYSKDFDDPVVLVRLSKDAVGKRVASANEDDDEDNAFLVNYYVDQNPYRTMVDGWEIMAKGLFKDPASLRDLFVRDSGFLAHCSDEELDAIRDHWGEEVFEQAVASEILAMAD